MFACMCASKVSQFLDWGLFLPTNHLSAARKPPSEAEKCRPQMSHKLSQPVTLCTYLHVRLIVKKVNEWTCIAPL
jgi:hypothetical protein